MSLLLPSPAKLNLFLHITGRREDGYHYLQTIFQFLDLPLTDQIHFCKAPEGEQEVVLTVSPELPEILAAEKNLIVRAAKLLQMYTGYHGGARIHLDKHLPIGGGVGGGSSNAASTLIGLNHIWQTDLDKDQLAGLGVQLGADVPVFVHGYASFAEGIGEQLHPLPDLHEPWYILVVPKVQVNTSVMYQHPQLPRNTPKITVKDVMEHLGENDFEEVVRKVYPEIDRIMHVVNHVGKACLTGSGSWIYAPFETQRQAEDAKRALQAYELQIFVSKGCNRSPLHRHLSSLSLNF